MKLKVFFFIALAICFLGCSPPTSKTNQQPKPFSSKEILANYVGDWTSDVTSKKTAWTPVEKNYRTTNFAKFVLDDHFLHHYEVSYEVQTPEQTGKVLFVWGYDSNLDKFVGWSFYSNGNIVKSIGVWDSSTQTFKSHPTTPPGITSTLTETFNNKNRIDGRLVFERPNGERTFDMLWTRTRSTDSENRENMQKKWAKIETPIKPIPPEVSRLKPLIGEWDSEYFYQPSAKSLKGQRSNGTLSSKWILDGRFLFATSKNGNNVSNIVMGYDTQIKKYIHVRFTNDGNVEENIGQWNETKKLLEWETASALSGKVQTTSTTIIEKDQVQKRTITKRPDGELQMDLKIKSTRR